MLEKLLAKYPQLAAVKDDISAAASCWIDTYRKDGKILVCGNGGSAADCEHIVGELMKGFLLKRTVTDTRIAPQLREHLQGGLPAISLPSQCGILSAFINDVSPEMMYAQLVYGYAKPEDTVVGLSTSGNSENVVHAMEVAKALGASTVSLTGAAESKLSAISDVTIRVPETETYLVQELHLPVYHYLCAETERAFFES